ncbi:hypothetical protein JVT61DRAFT_3690 [Boletus reticuloceps]|uniref:Fungal-type protein kinase domain-containing protein n=1 Tax=Boletus reticuloceps TaxID=495285 RepID=A0A8I2YPX6_9AGAM|nr:hypothetical protein JVT61DRAFT_3690 [Boletus reticuloceps]
MLRKPHVILVPETHRLKPHCNFRAIYTVCEVKCKDEEDLWDETLVRIGELSAYISATQLPRRFFIGMALCGPALTLTLHARGTTIISKVLDINKHQKDFLCILLGLTSCSLVWNG